MGVCVCPPNEEGKNPITLVIGTVFMECVYNAPQMVSFVFGWISIICWIVALLPNVRLSFITRTTEALSPVFLVLWLIGDALNFISCILLNALFTQIVLGAVWVVVDGTIVIQMATYTTIAKKLKKRGIIRPAVEKSKTKVKPAEAIIYVLIVLIILVNIIWLSIYDLEVIDSRTELGKEIASCKADSAVETYSARWYAGSIIAYICIFCYVGSRPNQIITMCKRKTAEGLSPSTFILTIIGNLSTTISIFFFSQDSAYLVERTPYILAAVIPAALDIVIVSLWTKYAKIDKKQRLEKEKELITRKESIAHSIELCRRSIEIAAPGTDASAGAPPKTNINLIEIDMSEEDDEFIKEQMQQDVPNANETCENITEVNSLIIDENNDESADADMILSCKKGIEALVDNEEPSKNETKPESTVDLEPKLDDNSSMEVIPTQENEIPINKKEEKKEENKEESKE